MAFTRTNFERQMDYAAVLAHGAHPHYRVEFDAEVDASTDTKKSVNLGIKQGSVVYLDSDTGKYNLGLAAASGQNFPVPIISLKNAFDPDVTTGVVGVSGTTTAVVVDGSTTYHTFSDYRKNTYSAVGGKITGIPCTAGYEIETAEFVAGTYKVNDALTTPVGAPGATVANRGKLTKATQAPFKATGSQPILGFVSRVPYENKAYIQTRIGFWTNFIPAVVA
ncbi:MAG: hypothetical protein IJT52_04340 [Spirochaetales bacterium]|nr:hypothetical protein [Spirochaetales bacterium]